MFGDGAEVKLRAEAEERRIAKAEPRARGRDDKHGDGLILCAALRRCVEDVGGGRAGADWRNNEYCVPVWKSR